MDKSTCSIDGCVNTSHCKGYCAGHYRRFSRGLEMIKPCKLCGNDYFKQGNYCSDKCRPECAFEWCSIKVNGKEYCHTHATNMKRSGKNSVRQWAADRECVVCGARDWEPNGLRRYCGQACAKLHRVNNFEPIPKSKACARCGSNIDLLARTRNGYKRKSSAFLCYACKRARHLRHKTSVNILRNRDGSQCRICDTDIDFLLRFPEPKSPSVDHIIPFSLGGTNDESNLQLAHLICNTIKSNRPGFKVATQS